MAAGLRRQETQREAEASSTPPPSMNGLRSMTYADSRSQLVVYGGRDFRSFSTAAIPDRSSSSYEYQYEYGSYGQGPVRPSTDLAATADRSPPQQRKRRGWGPFADPEFQRKRRVASYKAYSVERQVKGSFRLSFRWIKDRFNDVVHGWW